jgi:hypothetical protein
MTTEAIVPLRGEAELIRRAGHLFAAARREFLCAAEDSLTWSAGVNAAFARGHRPRRRPGLEVRKLYTPRALARPEAERHVPRVAASGATVRISVAPLPHEAIVIDGRTAILAGPAGPGGRRYSVIGSADVVAGVRTLFQAAWEAATDLADFRRARPPAPDEPSRRILDALSAGLTDETAARRLGMSLRTYPRRVANLMTTLDATSRFQAGLRARNFDRDT